jgi:hypothetical protein
MTDTKELIDFSGEYHADCNLLISKIEQLQARCAELELERDALAVHVEHWKDISEQCAVAQTKVEACTIYEQANEHSTPQRSLAAHDAEVARKAITKAKETFVLRSNGNEDFQAGIDYCVDAYDKHLDQYAQRIKDGEI